MTCHHVVKKSNQGKIKNAFRQNVPFSVVARVPQCDIAILEAKIPENFYATELQDSRLSNENNLFWTMTNFNNDALITLRGFMVSRHLMRTDAWEYNQGLGFDFLVSAGASGSPVFTDEGKVIGVICGVFKNVPRAMVIPAEQIISDCQAVYNLNTICGKKTGLKVQEKEGEIYITEIDTISPAYKASLVVGDKITAIGNWKTRGMHDYWLSLIVWTKEHPNQAIPFSIIKKEKNLIPSVVPIELMDHKIFSSLQSSQNIKQGLMVKIKDNETQKYIFEGLTKTLNSIIYNKENSFEMTGYIQIPAEGSYAFHLNFQGEGEIKIGDDFHLQKNSFYSAAKRGYFNHGLFPFYLKGKPTAITQNPILLIEQPNFYPQPIANDWLFINKNE